MARKPMIGIIPQWDDERERLWTQPECIEGILQAGGLPVLLPLTREPGVLGQIAREMDGFLFTEGHNISPKLYGERISDVCGKIIPVRDDMETGLFFSAVQQFDKPCFGISRGLQFFNAILGGTLYQDVRKRTEPAQLVDHTKEHTIYVEPNSPLHELWKIGQLVVSGVHYQGIRTLAPNLSVMATAKDGLIEAVRMKKKKFVWGVQWRPEFMLQNPFNQKLFSAFIEACL